MPVNNGDIDDFIECWEEYDPNGLGKIECYNIEKLVANIA